MAFLFNGADIKVLFDNLQNNLEAEIKDMSDEHVLSQAFDDLVQYLFGRHSVRTPTIDKDRIERSLGSGYVPEFPVPSSPLNHQSGVRGDIHTLHIPYSGDEHMFHYMPMPPPPQFVHGGTASSEITFVAGGAWFDAEGINKYFDDHLAVLEDGLERIERNVAPFNSSLRNLIVARLRQRIDAAEKTRQIRANLKYPLRRRDDAPQTYKLPEKPRQLSLQPAAEPKQKQGFSLLETDYQEILRICTSMSRVMEKSPTVFAEAEEEHIRVHYLVQLNGQFQGAATGETFNNKGSTDILIKQGDDNVFVAECKFWSGHKGMLATIDQLLSYTTWRDTKTALIIFNRNIDFTNVISEANRAMADHPCFVSGPEPEDESRFRYAFHHPEDKQRPIVITLMLFNMPKPVKS